AALTRPSFACTIAMRCSRKPAASPWSMANSALCGLACSSETRRACAMSARTALTKGSSAQLSSPKRPICSKITARQALTGLPNSALFRDRLAGFVSGAKHGRGSVTLVLIDLDHFTHLNNTLGRHAGDMLLKSVAERLRVTLKEPHSLARISADTFAIAFADLRAGADDTISLLQQHVFAAFHRSFVVDDNEMRLSARAGIAVYPADAADAETLFKNAEAALKHAQSSGETYLYYQPGMTARIAERLALEDELR